MVAPARSHHAGRGDTRKAFAMLKQFQVRRLSVVATDSTLKGVIAMNDIVLAAQQKAAAADTVSTLSALCAHRLAEFAAR